MMALLDSGWASKVLTRGLLFCTVADVDDDDDDDDDLDELGSNF